MRFMRFMQILTIEECRQSSGGVVAAAGTPANIPTSANPVILGHVLAIPPVIGGPIAAPPLI